jgi:hypothetical protein
MNVAYLAAHMEPVPNPSEELQREVGQALVALSFPT